MNIIDIHTHKAAPQPSGVISLSPGEFSPLEGQAYSVGIHPWATLHAPDEKTIAELERAAEDPQVVAIGECGYDAIKGGPAFRQLQILKKQIEVSERVKKPMVMHDVKGHEMIIGLKKDLSPAQAWAIHGMRQGAGVAAMLLQAGLYISLGEKFNPEALLTILESAPERLLAETDESPLGIEEVIARLSAEAGRDLTDLIRSNTSAFLGK